MLFRPSFCANCGEKIERTDWTLLTSRRFCPVCAIEFKGHEMLPKAVVAGSLIIGLFGAGAYLKSGAADEMRASVKPRPLAERPVGAAPQTGDAPPRVAAAPTPARETLPAPAAQTQPQARPVVIAGDQQFYCGAETKKGTPCSRRVKGNVRCYQHVGMPAMAGAERLAATK
jgi:hypothetical protein